MLRLLPTRRSRSLSLFQQSYGAKTFAGSEDAEDAKREKRRKRRQRNVQLKEWVDSQNGPWSAATAAIGSKHGHRENMDEEAASCRRLWEKMIRGARSRSECQRILKAWRKWEGAAEDGGGRRRQHQEQQQWGERQRGGQWEGGWGTSWSASFRVEFDGGFWAGVGGSSSSRRQSRTFEFFGEEELGGDGWWERQQRRRRQRQQEQQQGTSHDDGGDAGVRSSLRVLGLGEGTELSGHVVKQAFLRSAMQWHPDRHQNGSKAVAEAKFKEAQAAYQLLMTLVPP